MRFALIPAAVPVHPCSPLHAGVRVTSKQHNALLVCENSASRRDAYHLCDAPQMIYEWIQIV